MVDFTQFINEKETITAPSSGTVDFTQFINKKEEVSKPAEEAATVDFTKFIDTQPKPVGTQPKPVETPDEMDEDLLDTNKQWLSNAGIIYQAEEGEKWKGSQKALSDWMKDRHSKLNWDITNMGMTAYNMDQLTEEQKRAWLESTTQYEATDVDWSQFGRGLYHTLTDPITLLSVATGIGAPISF